MRWKSFECLWDLFRSIPSLEVEGASVLDEYYWLNKEDPNYSLCRATENRGEDAHTDGKFNLSQKGCMEIMKLFMTKMRISMTRPLRMCLMKKSLTRPSGCTGAPCLHLKLAQCTGNETVFPTVYPPYFRFAGFSALKFTRYNQYESLILPMKKYLEDAGVEFQFNTEVTNVILTSKMERKWQSH